MQVKKNRIEGFSIRKTKIYRTIVGMYRIIPSCLLFIPLQIHIFTTLMGIFGLAVHLLPRERPSAYVGILNLVRRVLPIILFLYKVKGMSFSCLTK